MKQTTLNASVTASPYDEHYDMALVYCADKESGHCFSLTRFPNAQEIEVMVIDQVVSRVLDLEVTLAGRCLQAKLPPTLVKKLDGIEQYVVNLDLSDHELNALIQALTKIFEGKVGFTLVEA